MIVDRITRYLEDASGAATEDQIGVALLSFKTSLLRNLTASERREEHEPTIRPSGPWYCPRRYHYNLTSATKEPLTWRSRMAFLLGDTIEAIGILLSRLSDVPMLSPAKDGTQKELKATIAGVPIKGHIDMSIRYGEHGETVVDWKSMATYGFSEFKRACGDKDAPWWNRERFGILFQLRIYMRLVREMGLGDGQYGLFVGVDKNTGHMAEMWVPYSDTEDALIDRAISAIHTNHVNGTLPDRPSWAKTVERKGANLLPDGTKGPCLEIDTDKKRTNDHGWRCSYCAFVTTCWPGFEVVPISKPAFRKPLVAEKAQAGKADDGHDSE